MHEMSLCESILGILQNHAQSQGFKRVKALWLEIGAFAGVEVAALKFSFEVISKDTLADQAQLHIINVPATAWCMQCSKEVELQRRFDACPHCGGYQLQITGGDQMLVKELEVE